MLVAVISSISFIAFMSSESLLNTHSTRVLYNGSRRGAHSSKACPATGLQHSGGQFSKSLSFKPAAPSMLWEGAGD